MASSDVCLNDLFQPSSSKVALIDPTLKQFGPLWFDMAQVDYTAAMLQCVGREARPGSVCLQYQRGRCQADDCNLVHVEREYLQAVRQALTAVPYSNCCLADGDLPSMRQDFKSFKGRQAVEIIEDGTPPFFVSPQLLALTAYWDVRPDIQSDEPIRVDAKRVCRLHQEDRCKLTSSCGNVHLCRKLWALRKHLLTLHNGYAPGVSSFLITPPSGPWCHDLTVVSGPPSQFHPLLYCAPTALEIRVGSPPSSPGNAFCGFPSTRLRPVPAALHTLMMAPAEAALTSPTSSTLSSSVVSPMTRWQPGQPVYCSAWGSPTSPQQPFHTGSYGAMSPLSIPTSPISGTGAFGPNPPLPAVLSGQHVQSPGLYSPPRTSSACLDSVSPRDSEAFSLAHGGGYGPPRRLISHESLTSGGDSFGPEMDVLSPPHMHGRPPYCAHLHYGGGPYHGDAGYAAMAAEYTESSPSSPTSKSEDGDLKLSHSFNDLLLAKEDMFLSPCTATEMARVRRCMSA